MDIARMAEVEETSDLVVTMMKGNHGKNQDQLDNIYRTFEVDFPEEDEIRRRFRLVMDKIQETLDEKLSNIEFSRKALFHTLFTFYYDLLFGLGTKFKRRRAKALPSNITKVILSASDRIANGPLNEELAKILRGATANPGSRKSRFEFLRQSLKRASTWPSTARSISPTICGA